MGLSSDLNALRMIHGRAVDVAKCGEKAAAGPLSRADPAGKPLPEFPQVLLAAHPKFGRGYLQGSTEDDEQDEKEDTGEQDRSPQVRQSLRSPGAWPVQPREGILDKPINYFRHFFSQGLKMMIDLQNHVTESIRSPRSDTTYPKLPFQGS